MNILDNRNNVLKVVKSIKKMTLKRVKKKTKEKHFIEGNDGSQYKVQLVVSLVKIPPIPKNGKVNFRTVMSKVPHSYVDEKSDVLFICKSTKPNKAAKFDNEYSVNAFKNRLFNYDAINLVSEVIALQQLKTDYNDFESKRKLARQFDVILCDRFLQDRMPSYLGKSFYRTKKRPIPIDTTNDLEVAIKDALSKTPLYLDMVGSCSTCQVGYVRQKDEHLVDNILAVVKSWRKKIPGGWDNINSIQIKSEISTCIPLYISEIHPKNIPLVNSPTETIDEIMEVSCHDFLPDSVELGIRKSGDITILPNNKDIQGYIKNRLESRDADPHPNPKIQKEVKKWSEMNNSLNLAMKKGRWLGNPFEERYLKLRHMNDVAGVLPNQIVSDEPIELEWDQLDVAAKSDKCRWLSQRWKLEHISSKERSNVVRRFATVKKNDKSKLPAKVLMQGLLDQKTKRRLAVYPEVLGWQMNSRMVKPLKREIKKVGWRPSKSK